MAYNPDANGKVEQGHSPIVKALAKACNGKMGNWPRLLPYALWAHRTIHSTTIGYMSAELMLGQKPIMPIEQSVTSWTSLPWQEEMSWEDLLATRIQQLERKPEDDELAIERLRQARLKNKENFDKKHRLRKRKIEGAWVLVYDSSLDNQYSTARKFAKWWFGPYMVRKIEINATYFLAELDGTRLALPITGKRINIFKRRAAKNLEIESRDDVASSIEVEKE